MSERFLVTATFRLDSIGLDDATVWQPAKREADYLFASAPNPPHPEISIIYGDGRNSGSGGWVAIIVVDSNDPRQTLLNWLKGQGVPNAAGNLSSTGNLGQLFEYQIELLIGNQDVQDFVPGIALGVPGHSW